MAYGGVTGKIRLIEEQNPGWVDLYPGISN
jgi:hypothetical protein